VSEDREWVQAVRPMARLISGQLTRKFIWGALGFSQLQHVFIGVEREDTERNATIFQKYYGINVMTPNDIRRKIGEPPSTSYWADMTKSDADIAVSAARGVGVVDDPDLNIDGVRPPAKPAPTGGKSKVSASTEAEDEE